MRALLFALILAAGLAAAGERSSAQTRAFQRQNPCPANDARRGPCPGHVIDHRIGLCVGGPDIPENMRWMTVEAAKAKDRWECRRGWETKLQECEERGCFYVPDTR